jgi:hypothetical protein
MLRYDKGPMRWAEFNSWLILVDPAG